MARESKPQVESVCVTEKDKNQSLLIEYLKEKIKMFCYKFFFTESRAVGTVLPSTLQLHR